MASSLMLVVLALMHTSAALQIPPTTPAVSSPNAIGKLLLDAALASPLYKLVMVPQAKSTMVKTAEANGVPWRDAFAWLSSRGPWALSDTEEAQSLSVPEYYVQPFHAYEEGNLCWDAALESEIASRAVGARNFPAYGADGEEAFRGAFEEALTSLGAAVPDDGFAVDLGCGSGCSTRRIASRYPKAGRVVGIDLSPHFLQVGRRLLELGTSNNEQQQQQQQRPPTTADDDWQWVNRRSDYDAVKERVELRHGLAEATGLPNESVDVVNIGLVIHECPPSATKSIMAEAYRLLKPGGQLWVTEMDFTTEGFRKLRANPLLFSLIRATEPYLDVYADYQEELPSDLVDLGFRPVRLAAATGRHFALLATKPREGEAEEDEEGGSLDTDVLIDDRRAETAKEDTHLKTWEAARKEEETEPSTAE